jgi:hypothetical protein
MAAGVGGCYDGPDWISAPSFSSLGDCPQVGDDRPNYLADAHANAQGEGALLCIAPCSSLQPMRDPSEIDGLAAAMQLAFIITSRETGSMQHPSRHTTISPSNP